MLLPHGLDNKWMEKAACLNKDVNTFFEFDRNPMKEQDAVTFCHNACSVRTHCLVWALILKEVGVWGGTTDKDRRSILSKPEIRDSLLDIVV